MLPRRDFGLVFRNLELGSGDPLRLGEDRDLGGGDGELCFFVRGLLDWSADRLLGGGVYSLSVTDCALLLFFLLGFDLVSSGVLDKLPAELLQVLGRAPPACADSYALSGVCEE